MTHFTDTTLRTVGHRRATRGLGRMMLSLLGLIRSRKALSDLDDHLLRDIGVTEEEARREAKRPVWDVPSTWRL